jgi:hypothetical protein
MTLNRLRKTAGGVIRADVRPRLCSLHFGVFEAVEVNGYEHVCLQGLRRVGPGPQRQIRSRVAGKLNAVNGSAKSSCDVEG